MAADDTTTLAELKALVADFRDERDWAQFHHPKDLAISISIEAAELLELFQWKSAEEIHRALQDPDRHRRLTEEVADIVVYCLNMSDTVGFDLATAISEKLERNSEKYPVEKARGIARKYNDL